jgi:hypothetical protein
MHLDRPPARQVRNCKIKRVNPAFRSVSTPRSTKDLPMAGPVNPTTSLGWPCEPSSASEWSPDKLCKRPRIGLASTAWTRLIRASRRRGGTLKQILRSALSEVA